jgi:hypothetical protein
MLDWMENRVGDFSRNDKLEHLLSELTPPIEIAENSLLNNITGPHKANLFVVGCPRAGTTLFMQALASSGEFSYPTNFLSRFFSGLGIGSKIQKMLFNEEFQFRNELGISKLTPQKQNYNSELGKTNGALSPHVFWYFWYKHFKYNETSYLTKLQWDNSDITRFINECHVFTNEWKKPSVMKAMIMNWNLTDFADIFESSLFVRLKRDKYSLANSILKARLNYSGAIDNWWSFKPPEFVNIRKLTPREQVAAFIISNEKALDYAEKNIDSSRFISIDYDDFCRNPAEELKKLKIMFSHTGDNLNLTNVGEGIQVNKRLSEDEISDWEEDFLNAKQKIKYLY